MISLLAKNKRDTAVTWLANWRKNIFSCFRIFLKRSSLFLNIHLLKCDLLKNIPNSDLLFLKSISTFNYFFMFIKAFRRAYVLSVKGGWFTSRIRFLARLKDWARVEDVFLDLRRTILDLSHFYLFRRELVLLGWSVSNKLLFRWPSFRRLTLLFMNLHLQFLIELKLLLHILFFPVQFLLAPIKLLFSFF